MQDIRTEDAEREEGLLVPVVEVVGVRTAERLDIPEGVGKAFVQLKGLIILKVFVRLPCTLKCPIFQQLAVVDPLVSITAAALVLRNRTRLQSTGSLRAYLSILTSAALQKQQFRTRPSRIRKLQYQVSMYRGTVVVQGSSRNVQQAVAPCFWNA